MSYHCRMLKKRRTVRASAPGKIILLGEHAVVYGRPAIAVPLAEVQAQVVARTGRPGTGIVIHAANLRREYLMDASPPQEPLAYTCRTVLRALGVDGEPDVHLTLRSSIPIASGMGSGAATAAAIARGLARWLGHELSAEELSEIVYETEMILHGTPSGIDNTVVSYRQPVWFRRGAALETVSVGAPLTLLVADTGISSPTRHTVRDVRTAWSVDHDRFESLFDRIGEAVSAARAALEAGDLRSLGGLMNENHALLRELGVSARENDRLAEAALAAGALGAKLSGGGRGGNNIALINPERAEGVRHALLDAGAVTVLPSTLSPQSSH
jgi:mevalonate kinase